MRHCRPLLAAIGRSFRLLSVLGGLAVLIPTPSPAQSTKGDAPPSVPKGDGVTDDAAPIQNALVVAAKTCGTVRLSTTTKNVFAVSSTIYIPKCVKLIGESGAVPDEGSLTPVGTTLKWTSKAPGPVVYFHDASGASMTGVSVDCQGATNSIGVQYDSDDNPPSSFVNINTLMIAGCHLGLVLGDQSNSAATSCPAKAKPPIAPNCAEADQLKFERFRILGADAASEGIHINSANAAQGSMIADGNFQGVNIGIHVISTNGGPNLIVESTNIGSETGPAPSFMVVENTVAVSPTLINNEVESPGTPVSSVVDHGCNPALTPGNPVWLNNTWNAHSITVDGNENITSIGNIGTQATLVGSKSCEMLNAHNQDPNAIEPHVVSINEVGWGPVSPNLAIVADGGASFGSSMTDRGALVAEATRSGLACKLGIPPGVGDGDLSACSGAHLGRLFLGQDLMLSNNSAGGLVVQGQLNTQIRAAGTSPTIASGFGASPSISGTSNAGRITVGSGGASSGAITFNNPYANPPLCVAQDETRTSAMRATASTTQLTIIGAMAAADRLTYICVGYLNPP
jgi:hypothetical protein